MKSSSAQTVAGSEPPSDGEVLVIKELTLTAHALSPPSCPPVGADLGNLDEFARAMTATWCGWSLLASPQLAWDVGA